MPLHLVASSAADWEISQELFTEGYLGAPNSQYAGPGLVESFGLDMPYQQAVSRFKSPLVNYWISTYVCTEERLEGYGSAVIQLLDITRWPFERASKINIQFAGRLIRTNIEGVTVATVPSSQTGVGVVYRLDIRVKIHPTEGEITVYLNGNMASQYLGDTSRGQTAHNGIRLYGAETQNTFYNQYFFSGFMVGTGDSRLFLPYAMPLSGNGDFQEWTGDYTDLDETVQPNLADFINVEEKEKRALFTFNKPATPAGYNIGAVVLGANVAKYGEVVDGISAIWYDGESVVKMGDYIRADLNFTGDQVISESNPVTGLRYTDEDLASMQFGFESF